MKEKNQFFIQLKSLPFKFWLINLVQMIEKMAYVIVLLQMPIYLAQKDIAGGMYLNQSMKGYIFFVWAMVQRITPFFTGGFSDKIGYKKTLLLSSLIIVISYLILGTQREFVWFMFGVLLLGFGSGFFLPALQASLTTTIKKDNESVAWGSYFLLLNLGVFIAPVLSSYLKSISWDMVFFGSAIVFLLNFIILIFIKIDKVKIEEKINIFSEIFTNFIKKEVMIFVMLMSGFIMIYMQFYETFPNFFMDWIDTRDFVNTLGLSDVFLISTNRGEMFSYEWIRLINSGIIIVAVLPISWFMSKIYRVNALILGIILATVGLIICGFTMSGWFSIFGILIYTFGELITNPKFTEQMNHLASENKKAMYLGFMNISFAIGLGLGALLGGYIYNYFGEKAYLASKYLENKFGMDNIKLTESMDILVKQTGWTYNEATYKLWDLYHPWAIWIFFMIFGIIAVFGLMIYRKKFTSDN